TRPPATTGDDQPRPGTAVFQATFFVSLHSIGSPCSVECPWPPGPRNCGQSSVARDTACASHNSASIVAPNRIAESLPPSGGQVCKRALCGVRPANVQFGGQVCKMCGSRVRSAKPPLRGLTPDRTFYRPDPQSVTGFVPAARLLVPWRTMLMTLPLALAATLLQAAQAPSFDYDKTKPVDAKVDPGAIAVTVQQLTYAQLDGTRNAATLVTPNGAGGGARPAILFLHWYEPPRPTSNRTEFLAEAVELAGSGVISLLVDTPWTKEDWFPTRDAARDYEFTVQMAKDVRRALDALLAAQPAIDKSRVALVGHDFGAMW